jgi:hypothetical protein
VFAIALVVGACGGRSTREESDGSGAQGGTGGSGSSVGGTTSNVGGTGTGATSFTGGTGATSFTGGTGNIGAGGNGTGGVGIEPDCYYGGVYYLPGSTYPAGDGCNTCTCTDMGSDCTLVACTMDVCTAIAQAFSDAMTRALTCTGGSDDCGYVITTIGCGCSTYVSDPTEVEKLHAAWNTAGCYDTVPLECPACLPIPTYHYCGENGMCGGSDTPPFGGAGGSGSSVGGSAGSGGSAGIGVGGFGAGGFAAGGLGGAAGTVAVGGFGGTAGVFAAGGFAGFAGSFTTGGLSGTAGVVDTGGFSGTAGMSSTSLGGYAGDLVVGAGTSGSASL